MTIWDPPQYLKFAGPRARPVLDLLARVELAAPARVFDLGCGTGHATRLLAERWPEASVTGIDGSAEMLAVARAQGGRVSYSEADLAGWSPPEPAELLFSNAALHWLDDHDGLFPRLLDGLAPGGVLAVQMPRNHAEPSHTCMVEAARAGPWRSRLEPALRPEPVAAPEVYYGILAPAACDVEIWQTEYVHVLEGENPVVEWTKATALRPLIQALDGAEQDAFLAEYARLIAAAYPPRADGATLFPFRRLFLIARR